MMPGHAATISTSELAAETRERAEQILQLLGSEEQFSHFDDEIVMEFPYGPSIGQPERHEGKEAVVSYVRRLNHNLAGLKMRDWTIHSVEGDPTTVFIEYEGDAPTPGGNSYVQTYVNKMQFRDGKLVHMREFWDPKRIIDANNGVYDAAQAN
jgi:ketosteroid isomerase-like protein